MFERFDNRYNLHGRVVTKTGLHIGAGGSLAVVGSDNPVVRDVNGLPYIPGSSFKGVLRSMVESIVRALSPGEHQEPWACDPLNDPCVKPEDLEGLGDDRISQLVERGVNSGGKACTICRLFGSPWLASKVKVCDLYLRDATNWLGHIEVRNGVAIDRDTETAFPGRLYDYEAVPRETEFNLYIRVDNATSEELGLLFLGLREFTNGGAWVGGNTSRGLGLVQIEWDELERLEERSDLLQYLREGQGRLETDPRQIQAFITGKIRAFLETIPEGQEAREGDQPPVELGGENHA